MDKSKTIEDIIRQVAKFLKDNNRWVAIEGESDEERIKRVAKDPKIEQSLNILRELIKNSFLRKSCLDENQIGDEGTRALAQALIKNSSLENLIKNTDSKTVKIESISNQDPSQPLDLKDEGFLNLIKYMTSRESKMAEELIGDE